MPDDFISTLLHSLPDHVFYKDLNGVYQGCNPGFARHVRSAWQYHGEIVGRTDFDIMPAEQAQLYRTVDLQIIETLRSFSSEVWFTYPDGTQVLHDLLKAPYHGPDGEVAGIIGVSRDISKRKQVEDALRESEAKNRAILNALPDLLFVHGRDGTYQDCYSPHVGLLAAEQLLGKTVHDVLPQETAARVMQAFDHACLTGKLQVLEYSLDVPLGLRDFLARIAPLDGNRVMVVVQDVTELKQAEEQIRSLAREKETLLKELQHRVKNSMSTMLSLLTLQAQELTEPTAQAALKDAQARLHSMGLLYDQLYQDGAGTSACIHEYVSELLERLLALFAHVGTVDAVVDVDKFQLDPKRLSAVGMIINEAVTNSMKYALNGHPDGKLVVRIRRTQNSCTLVVQDNGPGIPDGAAGGAGFGLSIIEALAADLGATLQMDGQAGTKLELAFSL